MDLPVGRADEVFDVDWSNADAGQLLVADDEHNRGGVRESAEHRSGSRPRIDLRQPRRGSDVIAELESDPHAADPDHGVGPDALALGGAVADRLARRTERVDDIGANGVDA